MEIGFDAQECYVPGYSLWVFNWHHLQSESMTLISYLDPVCSFHNLVNPRTIRSSSLAPWRAVQEAAVYWSWSMRDTILCMLQKPPKMRGLSFHRRSLTYFFVGALVVLLWILATP